MCSRWKEEIDGEGTEEKFVRGLVCYFVVIASWRVLAWR